MLRDMLKRRQPIPDFTKDELRAAQSILSPEQYQEVREILMGGLGSGTSAEPLLISK